MGEAIVVRSLRELDALVAEKVCGWTLAKDRSGYRLEGATATNKRGTLAGIALREVPRYSTSISAAWTVVEAVQKIEPGWRFALLGGDVSYGYASGVRPLKVDRRSLEAFGWKAEFFGHIDPAENYGDRHGTARADTPDLAICLAALSARGVTVDLQLEEDHADD